MRKIMGRTKDDGDRSEPAAEVDSQNAVLEELIEEKIRRILAEGKLAGEQQPQPQQAKPPQPGTQSQQLNVSQPQTGTQPNPQNLQTNPQNLQANQSQLAPLAQTEAQLSSQLEQNLQRLKTVIKETQQIAQKMESLLRATPDGGRSS